MSNDEIARRKARLVAKGFLQRHEIAFNEVYSLVFRHETIKIVVFISPYKGWNMHKLNVKSVFLDGLLRRRSMS